MYCIFVVCICCMLNYSQELSLLAYIQTKCHVKNTTTGTQTNTFSNIKRYQKKPQLTNKKNKSTYQMMYPILLTLLIYQELVTVYCALSCHLEKTLWKCYHASSPILLKCSLRVKRNCILNVSINNNEYCSNIS